MHGERVVHYDFITRGLAFPVHHFLRSLLLAYELQLHNLSPNSFLHIACFVTLCEYFLGINPHMGLWMRMFTIKRQGKDAIGCVDIQTPADAKFFNLRDRESSSRWKSRWFYVMDVPAEGRGFSLLEFSATASVKKTTAWSHKLGGTEGEEAETLLARVLSLMETPQLKVTRIHLIAAFIQRRIQPLQVRAHPMWAYRGVRDPTRISTVEFRSTEVCRRVQLLTDLGESEPCEIDPPVAPYGPDRPWEKEPDNDLSSASLLAKKRGREDNDPPFEETKAYRERLRAELGQCRQELQEAAAEKSRLQQRIDSRTSAEKEQEKIWIERLESATRSVAGERVLDASAELQFKERSRSFNEALENIEVINAEAKGKLRQVTKILTTVIRKTSPDGSVPESLNGLIDFFAASQDPVEEYCQHRSKTDAELFFTLALAHGVEEDILRRVASQSTRSRAGDTVSLGPLMGKGKELAEISLRQPRRSIEEMNLASSGRPEVGDLSLDIFDSLSPL
ncbi:hypothetical protein BRADI_2g31113v3 [Brachypodium distachyon]|uniref:Transposase (putative) gypsy type domain-containing protein n=1 Tax=Brachypodium distachyon TaxID=15368 RepID=A0A2K2DBB1_BRADI|nr:hypothetical protein BRADI_2g31113v3 [Brachypodium distachyon]